MFWVGNLLEREFWGGLFIPSPDAAWHAEFPLHLSVLLKNPPSIVSCVFTIQDTEGNLYFSLNIFMGTFVFFSSSKITQLQEETNLLDITLRIHFFHHTCTMDAVGTINKSNWSNTSELKCFHFSHLDGQWEQAILKWQGITTPSSPKQKSMGSG